MMEREPEGEGRANKYDVSFVYRHGLKRLHWVRRGRRQLKEMMETQQQKERKGKERKSNTEN